jgi:mandelamide amidase
MNTIDRREFLATGSALLSLGMGHDSLVRIIHSGAAQEFGGLSAVDAVTAMRNGEISAERYARTLLDRADHLRDLNAFSTVDRELVLANAREADLRRASGRPLGTLHGLPLPVKDSINSAALPTGNGTRALRGYRPTADAEVLSRLLARGAILMGKTNIHELSYGWTSNNEVFGPVRNPYNPSRVPGGSSGGSAVAVAARMAPLAVGEDTFGSIRVPASMCGIVGFRPSYGRYPGAGIMPLTLDKFDQVGPLARSVADVVLFDTALTTDVGSVEPVPLRGARIGISPSYFLEGLDPEVRRVTDDALARIRDAGATVVVAELPEPLRNAVSVGSTLIAYETLPAIEGFLRSERTGIPFEQLLEQSSAGTQSVLRSFALPPNRPPLEAYQSALSQRDEIQVVARQYFEANDLIAIAFPPIPLVAPVIGDEAEVSIGEERVPIGVAMTHRIALGTCARLTSLVLPAGMSSAGLPVGIEFDGPSGSDRRLLSLGLSLERALGSIAAPNT